MGVGELFMGSFRGKVAVVTGAASGIGFALCERFAAEGMRVVMADVERPALEGAAEAIRSGGAEVVAVPTDVSLAEEVEALAEKTVRSFGTVDVVCNNAGVAGGVGPVWERSLEEWQWVFGVNLFGVIHGIRAFVPLMLRQEREGYIVNTASVVGLTSMGFGGAYGPSKHAVVAVSESLQIELTALGAKLRVAVICPGGVRTRIAEADRNCPYDAVSTPDTPAVREQKRLLRDAIAQGTDPAEIANCVVEAMRGGRFYVLPHPELNRHIAERSENILAGRPPGSAFVLK